MTAPLEFRPMLAGDAVLLALQPSQHFELGLEHSFFTIEEGEDLVGNGISWTAHRGSRIVTVAGFRQLFPGHAIAWAAFSDEIGRDHLAITRFARKQVENAPYRRLEAIVEAANSRAVEWASLIGLEPAHVLRNYGPQGQTNILFERISEAMEPDPCK